MIIHYNCTIGSILLHSFLLIYHPYPPSFHEMIFILVYIGTYILGNMDNLVMFFLVPSVSTEVTTIRFTVTIQQPCMVDDVDTRDRDLKEICK